MTNEASGPKPPLRFALFAGACYYPGGGWEDLWGTYATPGEARAEAAHFHDKHHWWQIVDLTTGTIIADS